MGSKAGYDYSWTFSLGDLSEIQSRMTIPPKGANGLRPVVIEIRTVFSIFWKKTRKGGVREIIGEETFDMRDMYECCAPWSVHTVGGERLYEYWMVEEEIQKFCEETVAYVREIADQHASLPLIPVYVDFEVRTVQQEGEAYTAVEARAITPSKLDPIYLKTFQTRPPNVEIFSEFIDTIYYLPRTRVESVDQGLAIMTACCICKKGPCVGGQIAKLRCGCRFHSHCVVRWFEKDNHCPVCLEPEFKFWNIPYVLPSSS